VAESATNDAEVHKTLSNELRATNAGLNTTIKELTEKLRIADASNVELRASIE
jgi:hypothetical protein